MRSILSKQYSHSIVSNKAVLTNRFQCQLRQINHRQTMLMTHRRCSNNVESSINDRNELESKEIYATKLWVEEFVFRNSLCPWVGKTLAQDQLRLTLVDNSSRRSVINAVLEESKSLIDSLRSHDNHTTTLLVLKHDITFEAFLELIESIERLLDSKNMSQYIQIASFHPDYQFDKTDINAAENYTNRSPYPTIHLLRVIDVSNAIESYEKQFGSTDLIWKNNVLKMKSIGINDLTSFKANLMNLAELRYKET